MELNDWFSPIDCLIYSPSFCQEQKVECLALEVISPSPRSSDFPEFSWERSSPGLKSLEKINGYQGERWGSCHHITSLSSTSELRLRAWKFTNSLTLLLFIQQVIRFWGYVEHLKEALWKVHYCKWSAPPGSLDAATSQLLWAFLRLSVLEQPTCLKKWPIQMLCAAYQVILKTKSCGQNDLKVYRNQYSRSKTE